METKARVVPMGGIYTAKHNHRGSKTSNKEYLAPTILQSSYTHEGLKQPPLENPPQTDSSYIETQRPHCIGTWALRESLTSPCPLCTTFEGCTLPGVQHTPKSCMQYRVQRL